jgi:hypothetical protein
MKSPTRMRAKRDQLSLVIVMSSVNNNYYYYLVDFVLYADAATVDLGIRLKP